MAVNFTFDGVVNNEQLLEFGVAFPNEKQLSPAEYLKGGSKSIILNVASFFLGFNISNSKYRNNHVILQSIFSRENDGLMNEVHQRIIVTERERSNRIRIINPYSSLKLFEYFFSTESGVETQTAFEFEINLFKAYLVINSEVTRIQNQANISTKELGSDLKIPMMSFCSLYPISDKVNYNINQIWGTQIIKTIYLFQFLESYPGMEHLLKAFLLYFEKPTWQEYLKSLIPLTVPIIREVKEGHVDFVVTPGDKFEEGCTFIEKLVVQENDPLDENDFLTLRTRPFYKVDTGVYRIIFKLFVVEKIFKGVYFFLRDINKGLPEGRRVKELKSIYGHEFSEKVMLYTVMQKLYLPKCIHFTGKQFDDLKIDGAPDYYLRKGKSILLFESKDFLIQASKKASFDYKIYNEEFKKLLYFEKDRVGKIKNKAVKQLINNVRRILKNEFTVDTSYHYKDVFIYPILITHDHQYDTLGFNELINHWFQQELDILAQEGLFTHHVKPLVVINIDTLIFYQKGLAEDIQLHEVLNLYEKQIRLPLPGTKTFRDTKEYEQFRMSKMVPFSFFIDRLFFSKGIEKLPPLSEFVVPALFKVS